MESIITTYRKVAGITQAALAAKLGVQPPAICKWEGGRVPAERVLDVERVTGISRHDIRPDLYPREAA